MTQDEIIEMAKQVGEDWWADDLDLEAFASLVAQHEREACAKICDAEAKFGGSNGKKEAGASNCASSIRARGQE
jgi:hypothetical protein